MRKYLKFIVPAVCVIIVAITFYMIFDLSKKAEEQNNNNAENTTAILDNTANTTNTVTNTADDQETENYYNDIMVTTNTANTETTENTTVSEDDIISDEETDALSATNQKSAVELVEEYWGEDDTVYYTNEGVNSDGEQIVAVRSKSSTVVKQYFRVNLSTGEVELDF